MNDDILGYLFDGLELPEQQAFEKRLDEDPELRAELERLRKLTIPLAADDLIEPPAGLAERTAELLFEPEPQIAASRDEWPIPPPNRVRVIDLIVAASVLIIAATIALPALAHIRGDHAKVLCSNQLRNLGVAIAMYADSESGYMPFIPGCGPMNNAGSFAIALLEKDLIKDRQELLCPGANSALVTIPTKAEFLSIDDPSRAAETRSHMGGSYGYTLGNRDKSQGYGFRFLGNSRPVMADRPPRATETWFVNSPNHGDRGQNVLYTDGTVQWKTNRVLMGDDIYRNLQLTVAAGIRGDDVVIGSSESSPSTECPSSGSTQESRLPGS